MKLRVQVGLALFALTLCLGGSGAVHSAYGVSEGQSAPGFVLPDEAGNQTTLSELKGNVVYLDFWASWCGPCKHSLPFMNEIQAKFADRGLVVLAVNLDTDRERATQLMKRVQPQYRVLFDPKGDVAKEYAPPTMPTSYIIDRAGRVQVVHPKFTPEDRAAIVAAIEASLGGGK